MFVNPNGKLQLTYCTNIHPANGWPAVYENLRRYAPALRQRFSPDQPFGLGLRLSARDAHELLQERTLDEFARFLSDERLYVALINGFPHGSFHGERVKDQVFAPDWAHPERLRYTQDLVRILKCTLPENTDGGISTIPLSYKRWPAAGGDDHWRAITKNLVSLVAVLMQVQQEGKFMHLDIEPEPDGLVETAAELIAFYERWLLPVGGRSLAAAFDCSEDVAREHLLRHVQVCLDCCHSAVEFENIDDSIAAFTSAGIRIGRVQLSSALRVAPEHAQELQAFAEPVYLHQVIQDGAGCRCQHADLPDALNAKPCVGEWRVHFHVPLFLETYGALSSTQDQVRDALAALARRPFTTHAEIETYTWDVLPQDLRLELGDSIAREYEWVLQNLAGARS